MKVSHNELQNLCRKAFAGIGFDDGDAADAADMVAWMQAHGMPGLQDLRRGLDYLLVEPSSCRPALLYEDADLAVLDGHGMSVLRSSSLALELGFAKARARGLSIVKIRHCHNRQLITGYLSRLSVRGMNVTAFWRNGHEPLVEQVVGFRANSAVPEIRVYRVKPAPEETEGNDGVTLIMANHVELLPTLSSDYLVELVAQYDESRLRTCRDRALKEGIEVDDTIWACLKELADRMLVESSEESRSGAGSRTADND